MRNTRAGVTKALDLAVREPDTVSIPHVLAQPAEVGRVIQRALAELLMRWNEIKNRDVKALNEQLNLER